MGKMLNILLLFFVCLFVSSKTEYISKSNRVRSRSKTVFQQKPHC